MKFDPTKHHRRSIRLKGYDYTSPGGYFITVVTYQRECLFGEIVNGEMRLNEIGKFVEYAWNDLPNHYPNIELGTFCIMPNHVHGIIVIKENNVYIVGAGLRPAPTTHPIKQRGLPEIVRAFKSFSSRHVNEYLKSPGVPLWQRNYYEHIIRNDDEWNNIHLYIETTPLYGVYPINWATDNEIPTIAILCFLTTYPRI